ncbi:MAG: helix-turn-helix domain-containing protein [Candidatus Aenigmarchaeota archaeon]|nr:helix-turn-helix domain-containing protein [Candidatus Aenigmarchaeota archaeon]
MEKIEINKDLVKIRSLIGRIKKVKVREDLDEILTQLKELDQKVEDIEKALKRKKQTPKILRKKKQIIFLLRQKVELAPSELGKILNLSRSRANEYLKEMEKEKIVKGILKGRKKFYRLLNEVT